MIFNEKDVFRVNNISKIVNDLPNYQQINAGVYRGMMRKSIILQQNCGETFNFIVSYGEKIE